jgi:hypothetical protein
MFGGNLGNFQFGNLTIYYTAQLFVDNSIPSNILHQMGRAEHWQAFKSLFAASPACRALDHF